MPVAIGVRPLHESPLVVGISCPVDNVTGLPAFTGQLCGPLSVSFDLLSGSCGHINPHTPQKRGMPVPSAMRIVLPSALTVPGPAIFHSPVPPIGLPSKYQMLM